MAEDEKKAPAPAVDVDLGADDSAGEVDDNNAAAADDDDEPCIDVWYDKCVVCSKTKKQLKGRKPLLNTWCSLACAEHWLANGGEEGVKLLEKYAKEKREKWKDRAFSRRAWAAR